MPLVPTKTLAEQASVLSGPRDADVTALVANRTRCRPPWTAEVPELQEQVPAQRVYRYRGRKRGSVLANLVEGRGDELEKVVLALDIFRGARVDRVAVIVGNGLIQRLAVL